ncbi:MAG: galactokinase [Pyrinomonadaceae bacterium]|nr:galactokinase [Sphingobacteriaceae bacterium]
MANLKTIVGMYRQKYNSEPLLVRSPARIILIGEHTDYHLGPVLPATINKYLYLAIGLRIDNEIHIESVDFNDRYATSLSELVPALKLWPNYLLGVINEFHIAGKINSGINIVFGGEIPLSTGLASSASVTCATAFALNKLFDGGCSLLEIAKIAQRAEHTYLGVECGLLDQYTNFFGKEGFWIKINCRSLEHTYVPATTNEVTIVLFDSGIRHNLVNLAAAFKERKRECKRGIALVQQHEPQINSLADISREMLSKYVEPVDLVSYKRCLYVVQEINRFENICKDLEKQDFKSIGQRLFENHEGLKDLYEVSCDECDFLVDVTKKIPEVFGSRMMGAGFGGCTINLIKSADTDSVIEKVKKEFVKKYGRDLKVYLTTIGNATEEVTCLPDLN